MSLLFGDNYSSTTTFNSNSYDYAFKNIFNGWTSLIDASRLNFAATNLGLASHVYEYMFSDCTRLKVAPKLEQYSTKLLMSGWVNLSLNFIMNPFCYLSSFVFWFKEYFL